MRKEDLQKLENTLWKSADQLRGSLDAPEYKDVILPIFFLKHINDLFKIEYEKKSFQYRNDEESYIKDSILYLPKESRWDYILEKIKSDGNPKKIKDYLSNALTSLSNIEDNKEWLENVFPLNYFIDGKYNSYDLNEILNLFDKEINIIPSDHDSYGHIYEYFLNQFALASGRQSGEFYTPKSIVKLMVSLIKPLKGKIYDPCFGSGGMFTHAFNYIKKHHPENIDNISFYGQEKNRSTWTLCKMNMIVHRIPNPFLGQKWACTFLNDLHSDNTNKMDYILANPPFNLKKYWSKELEDSSRWQYGIPPKGNANYAWIQHIISKLSEDGTAAFIMSLGTLTSQNTKKIRQKILEDNLLDAIIVIPDKLFYSTNISACIWILKKNKTYKDVLFANLSNKDFGTLKKSKRELENEDIEEVASIYEKHKVNKLKNKPNWYHRATFQEIKEKDFSLLPNEYIEFLDDDQFDWNTFKNDLNQWKEINKEKDIYIKKVEKILNDFSKLKN